MSEFNIKNFPTYGGDRPTVQGKYYNESKEQIEDWTHRSLKSEDPHPLSIKIGQLGGNPGIAYENWVRSLTAENGG